MKKVYLIFFCYFLIYSIQAQRVEFEGSEGRSKEVIQFAGVFENQPLRWLHNEKLYSYGNLTVTNELPEVVLSIWSYDIDGEKWEQLTEKEGDFFDFFGAVTWVGDNVLWAFGGFDPATGESHNQLWAYDIESNEWKRIEAKEFIPPARSYATVWEDEKSVWVFGGEYMDKSGQTAYLNDLWEWNKKENSWREIKVSERSEKEFPTLQARSRSLCWYDSDGDLFYLFGGMGKNGGLNDLWAISKTGEWKELQAGSNPFTPSVTRFDQLRQEVPTAINPGHRQKAMCWHMKGELWLWGGHRASNQSDPLLWVYSTEKGEWRHIIAQNYPDVEQFQTLIQLDGQTMSVFGTTPVKFDDAISTYEAYEPLKFTIE